MEISSLPVDGPGRNHPVLEECRRSVRSRTVPPRHPGPGREALHMDRESGAVVSLPRLPVSSCDLRSIRERAGWPRPLAEQCLEDRQIRGVDEARAVQVGIRVGAAEVRFEGREIGGIDEAALIEVSVAAVAITVSIGIGLIRVFGRTAVVGAYRWRWRQVRAREAGAGAEYAGEGEIIAARLVRAAVVNQQRVRAGELGEIVLAQ